jgi:hypothetical protein
MEFTMKTIHCLKFSIHSLVTRQKAVSFWENSATIRPYSGHPARRLYSNSFAVNTLGKTLTLPAKAGMGDAKSHRMMHKVSLLPTMMVLLVAAVAARVRAMIDAQVPVGYQDETGFHAGVKRTSEPRFPSLW